MGSIISSIEQIDRIHWKQLRKGRPVKAIRVMAIDETQVIIELEGGSYTIAGRRHTPNGNWAVMGYGLDRFGAAVLDGLVRMGILSKEQVSAHKKREAEKRSAQDKKYAVRRLEDACATLGIPVPVSAAKVEAPHA